MKDIRLAVARVMSLLTPDEKYVIEFRYGLRDGQQRPHDWIAAQLETSVEAVRRLEADALRTIRGGQW